MFLMNLGLHVIRNDRLGSSVAQMLLCRQYQVLPGYLPIPTQLNIAVLVAVNQVLPGYLPISTQSNIAVLVPVDQQKFQTLTYYVIIQGRGFKS